MFHRLQAEKETAFKTYAQTQVDGQHTQNTYQVVRE